MPGRLALSENVTTVPSVLNYICFMRIVVKFIVPNTQQTLTKALI